MNAVNGCIIFVNKIFLKNSIYFCLMRIFDNVVYDLLIWMAILIYNLLKILIKCLRMFRVEIKKSENV